MSAEEAKNLSVGDRIQFTGSPDKGTVAEKSNKRVSVRWDDNLTTRHIPSYAFDEMTRFHKILISIRGNRPSTTPYGGCP